MARGFNRISTPGSSARAMFGGFKKNAADRGMRYAIGAMGGVGSLRNTRGYAATSSQAKDAAILARGGKRIAGAIAMGAAVGGYKNRTTSGLNSGRTGMTKY